MQNPSIQSLFSTLAGLLAVAGWAGAAGGGLLLALLLVSAPSVQRLGLGAGSFGGLLTSVLGVHLAWGFWGAQRSRSPRRGRGWPGKRSAR